MISAWHLLWIVPLAAAFGLVIGAILAVGGASDPETITPINKLTINPKKEEESQNGDLQLSRLGYESQS